jgi:hypothetical protein
MNGVLAPSRSLSRQQIVSAIERTDAAGVGHTLELLELQSRECSTAIPEAAVGFTLLRSACLVHVADRLRSCRSRTFLSKEPQQAKVCESRCDREVDGARPRS